MNLNLVSLFMAFAITFILTPVVRRVALSLRILDYPNARKTHNSPMPLLGSVAVYLGILAALGFSQLVDSLEREVLIVFFTGTFLLIIGILDDWGILHPQIKLIVAMPVPSYGTITNSFLHFLSEGEISSTS